MIASNQQSTVRISCAGLLMGLLCAGVAFAPPPPPPPPAFLFGDQPFAAIMCEDQDNPELLLEQNGTTCEGCINLRIVNNLPLNVKATVVAAENMNLPSAWFVKLNEPGEKQVFQRTMTSNKISDLHQPGEAGDLQLCVRVQGVGFDWHASHRGLTTVQVARVTLTVMPEF